MGTARGKISYNRKDDLCDCRTHFVFVFLDVNVHALLWRWDVKAEVTKQTFFRDRRMIAGVSSNVYLLRVTLCLLRCSMPIIYLKDLLKWLWAFGPRASQKTTTTAKKKKKERNTSLEQNKENTHTGSLKKRKIKRVGGYFCCRCFVPSVPPFCRQNWDSKNIWSPDVMYSGAVSALRKGNRAAGAFEVICEKWTGLYTSW